nr:LysR family transcriptional regulator [Erwinia sp. S43]
MHIAPSSVARHIEQLEQDLGTVLFQRSPQGYVLTTGHTDPCRACRIRNE